MDDINSLDVNSQDCVEASSLFLRVKSRKTVEALRQVAFSSSLHQP